MEDQKGAPPSNLPVIKKPEEIKPPAPSAPPSAPRVIPPPPPPPSATPNAPKPPTGPLSSSFRTMASDLEAAKKGQSPTGSVLQIKPEAPKITTQEKPLEPSKPSGPSTPPLEVGLGKTEKARPLFTPAPPKPISPPPAPKPAAVIVPPKKSSSKLVTLLIILLLLLGGGAYWYFGLRTPQEVVLSPTPTPEPTLSETPRPALAESFKAIPHTFPEDNIVLAFSSLSAGKADFPALSFEKPVFLKPINTLGSDLTLSAFIQSLGIAAPEGFDSSISQNNWLIFYHGQKESFSSKGVRTESAVPSAKIGLVAEVQDSISLRSALNVWEATMSADMDVLLGYSPAKAKVSEFSDNQYRSESIRYINFSHPDMSLDYAIVTGSDGVNYLVISSSREGIYSIIDLLGSL